MMDGEWANCSRNTLLKFQNQVEFTYSVCFLYLWSGIVKMVKPLTSSIKM